jgi:hypothetical protein
MRARAQGRGSTSGSGGGVWEPSCAIPRFSQLGKAAAGLMGSSMGWACGSW